MSLKGTTSALESNATARLFIDFRNFLAMLPLGTEILPFELGIMDLPAHAQLWLNSIAYEMALQNSTRPGKLEC